MNAKKEAKLSMYHSVIALCEDKAAIIALVPAFEISYNLFKALVTAIMAAATQLAAQTGGLRISKRVVKKQLAELCSSIAGLVYAYASVIHDDVLREAMHITSSDIYNAKDDETIEICNNVYTTANTNLAVLGDYGVTAPLLLLLQNTINDYADKAPKPVLNRSQRKALRAQMYALFDDGDVILKEQMDKLAVNYLSNGNALFYGEYHAAREIMDPGSFKTVLKILVLNGTEPLTNVKCYRDSSEVVKRSSRKGFITYKNIEQGNHTFKLKHKGFADATTTAMMSYGEKKLVSVVMVGI